MNIYAKILTDQLGSKQVTRKAFPCRLIKKTVAEYSKMYFVNVFNKSAKILIKKQVMFNHFYEMFSFQRGFRAH